MINLCLIYLHVISLVPQMSLASPTKGNLLPPIGHGTPISVSLLVDHGTKDMINPV